MASYPNEYKFGEYRLPRYKKSAIHGRFFRSTGTCMPSAAQLRPAALVQTQQGVFT